MPLTVQEPHFSVLSAICATGAEDARHATARCALHAVPVGRTTEEDAIDFISFGCKATHDTARVESDASKHGGLQNNVSLG